MIPSDIRLYTWLDVEEVLARQDNGNRWPEELVWVRAYWDGLTVGITPGSEAVVTKWLQDRFEPRAVTSGNQLSIALECTEDAPRVLPVAFEVDEQGNLNLPVLPTLNRPAVLVSNPTILLEPRPFSKAKPKLIAFHSFKGGVGRTTHALAMADQIAKNGDKVLLVDADLEAPGISWLAEQRLSEPPISFSDFLSLIHADPDPLAQQTRRLVQTKLEAAFVDGIYIMPAFRSNTRFASVEIRPEHVIQSSTNPFLISDLLLEVGSALGVAAVVIDLRAGLSELSAGLLLDARVQRILVTTLGGQPVEGTVQVLELIAQRAPSIRESDPVPLVVLNQVPKELIGTEVLTLAEQRLIESARQAVRVSESTDTADLLSPLRGPCVFDQSVTPLSRHWDEAIGAIRRSVISSFNQTLVDELLPRGAKQEQTAVPSSVQDDRTSLAELADRLVFAESGEGQGFLAIRPLRDLVESSARDLPTAVVIGGKGAGKTYSYLQILRAKNWSEFARATKSRHTHIAAPTCPVLQPHNLRSPALQEINSARAAATSNLGLAAPMSSSDLKDSIREMLKQPLNESEWRERWLDIIAWSVGFMSGQSGYGRTFIEFLEKSNRKLVGILDGLEDLFQDLQQQSQQQIALRSLLQDVPEWLSQRPIKSLGIVIFIRRDMVTGAVRQNSEQFLHRYERFALRWNRLEALRLVCWVAVLGNVVSHDPDEILELDEQTLNEILVTIWGRKLGKDQSREGRSADWVITALSDLRGQIQARDVVRFLAVASQGSKGAIGWDDRILTPSAIRNAIKDCSQSRIIEVEEEDKNLKEIFSKLKSLNSARKQIPFTAADSGLEPNELKSLEDNGVVLLDEDKYYMPEIFRQGLEFRLPSGARPKVLSLARRAAERSRA